MSEKDSKNKLNRNLSFTQVIALASGAVIGGWIVEAGYMISLTGGSCAFIFPILGLLLIPIGLTFGELTAMLPFTSSVDVWTTNAFGHKAGWAAQWLMFLIQVVEPPMMAFIFTTVLGFFIPMPPNVVFWVAVSFVVAWYIISNFNISITGNIANVLVFSMLAISILVAFSLFTSGHWSFANIVKEGGLLPNGKKALFMTFAVFSLKFIGFEMTPTMIEETNFPRKHMWKIVLIAIFIPAVVYCTVFLAMGGSAPLSEISAMTIPEVELVNKFGLPVIIGTLALISGILHTFTTLMGFWVSSARLLYGSAELNHLPTVLTKTNRFGQPYVANFVVLLFSIFFCCFTGENWIEYIYGVSCIAAGIVYFMCCLDAMILRRKHPEWDRPFTAPGGDALFIVGMIVSIGIMVGAALSLPLAAYASLGIYFLIGVVIYILMEAYRKSHPGKYELSVLGPEDADATAE